MADTTPRLAALCTCYFPKSHADVILRRWWNTTDTDRQWGWPGPRTQIVSAHIIQFPDHDMGRDTLAKHSVPLYDSIAGALTMGTDDLAVDGVILVGEHGQYPHNDLGQHLYPRKEMFDEVVAVFRQTGKSVPVFCDKHLSWNFDWAQQMFDTAAEMGFLLFGGSSLPHTFRRPPCPSLPGMVNELVALFYHGDEAYGFHSYDLAQAMIELSFVGQGKLLGVPGVPGVPEVPGVESITAHRGAEVWELLDQDQHRRRLFDAALATVTNPKPGDCRANCAAKKENPWGPSAFEVRYEGGLRATHFNLGGHIDQFALALDVAGATDPVATCAWLPDEDLGFPHFAALSAVIQHTMLTGQPCFAPQRTLLTTGITAAAMHARAEPGRPRPTPELAIRYQPFFRGPTIWR